MLRNLRDRRLVLVILNCALMLLCGAVGAADADQPERLIPQRHLQTLLDSSSSDSNLPKNPRRWTCASSRNGASRFRKKAWCRQTLDRGEPLPSLLRHPPPLSEPILKNAYDIAIQEFAEARAYLDLGWQHDQSWRFTGPYVGTIGSGENYGTHIAIRVAYSPEVIDWLCDGRRGELPDGAMIVKEMASIDSDLGVELDQEGCMTIPGDVTPDSWTIMIKQRDQSRDGWYWLFLHEDETPWLLGRSGLATWVGDFYADGFPPTEPDPDWYPTGGPTSAGGPSLNSYGGFCIQCHGVANSESTFSSLDNLLGKSLRYKLYDDESSADDEYDDSSLTTALTNASASFLAYYDQLDEVSFTQAWALRLPGQSYDHVVASAAGPGQFLTSDQCWSCHGSHLLLAQDSNMVLTLDDEGTTEELDLSPHGEWRASPMGLSGRDPVFFAQLQGETNHFPSLKTCIESTCFHCHGAMGERQLAIDTPGADTEGCEQLFAIPPPPGVPFGRPFTREMLRQWPGSKENEYQKYAALARDGVSCTVCHHISRRELGQEQTFTGNFLGDSAGFHDRHGAIGNRVLIDQGTREHARRNSCPGEGDQQERA